MKNIDNFIYEKLVINSKTKIKDNNYFMVYPQILSTRLYLSNHYKDRIINTKHYQDSSYQIYYILSLEEIKDMDKRRSRNIWVYFPLDDIANEKDIYSYIDKYNGNFATKDLTILDQNTDAQLFKEIYGE